MTFRGQNATDISILSALNVHSLTQQFYTIRFSLFLYVDFQMEDTIPVTNEDFPELVNVGSIK